MGREIKKKIGEYGFSKKKKLRLAYEMNSCWYDKIWMCERVTGPNIFYSHSQSSCPVSCKQ